MALDATTGAVLAMYSSPSYDPNQLASSDATEVSQAFSTLSADPNNPLTNRAISQRYAPARPQGPHHHRAVRKRPGRAGPRQAWPLARVDHPAGTATEVSNIESSTCGDGNPTLTEAFARSCNTTFVLAPSS